MKFRKKSQSGVMLIGIVLLVLIFGLIGALVFFNMRRVREQHHLDGIITNLYIIEGAKDQWTLSHSKKNGDTPTPKDLTVYMMKGISPPEPIIGETYEINAVGTSASAVIPKKLCDHPKVSKIVAP